MNNKYDRIIEASLKLFTEKGFHNTPTSLIAKEANVATGTLFKYFENKETLISTVYLESKDALVHALASDLDITGSIPSIAKKMFVNGIKWCMDNPERFLFFQTYSHSPFISKSVKEEEFNKFAFLHTIIKHGQKDGYLKQIPSEFLFNAVYGLMMQMMLFFYTNPERFKNDQDVENAFTVLWDAIKR